MPKTLWTDARRALTAGVRAAEWVRRKNLVLQSYVAAMACLSLAPVLPGGAPAVVPVCCATGVAGAVLTVKLPRVPTMVALALAVLAYLTWSDGGAVGGNTRAVVAAFFGLALLSVELVYIVGRYATKRHCPSTHRASRGSPGRGTDATAAGHALPGPGSQIGPAPARRRAGRRPTPQRHRGLPRQRKAP